jgi:hypothetical protein
MSVAFLHLYVNLPIPLYGTLLSIIIASAMRYLPYGMRYAYAGVLQIHVDTRTLRPRPAPAALSSSCVSSLRSSRLR